MAVAVIVTALLFFAFSGVAAVVDDDDNDDDDDIDYDGMCMYATDRETDWWMKLL